VAATYHKITTVDKYHSRSIPIIDILEQDQSINRYLAAAADYLIKNSTVFRYLTKSFHS
jgi:hypothetical protein